MKFSRPLFFLGILSLVLASIFFPSFSHADPLDNWHWRNPLPQGNHLYGVTYQKNVFVAVGSLGTIITSSDGVSWTQSKFGIAGNTFYDVQYGDGLFIAVGGNDSENYNTNIIATSPDGINWSALSLTFGGTLRSITFGNGTYVAVGYQGTVVTSNDGISWTPRDAATAQNLTSIAFGKGMFVAVGGGTGYKETIILTSNDGVTWTPLEPGTSNGLFGITFGNGRFVAVGNNKAVLTSTDGVNWLQSTVDVSINGAFTFFRVNYSNGLYIAVGSPGVVATSSDGVAWNASQLNTYELYGIAFGSGTFILVGYNGFILTSPDGSNWGLRTSGTSYRFSGITYANGTFIAVGSDDAFPPYGYGLILTSSDGLTWTSRISGIRNRFSSVAYASDKYGGLFVAVGDDGAILISQDTANWSIVESGTRGTLQKVIYEHGRFVAVGGGIVISSDGVNWSQASATDTTSIPSGIGVAYGNGIFATFGFISADGVNWNPVVPVIKTPRNVSFNDIAFGSGTFVAVGGTQSIGFAPPMPVQIIVTSSDGINWTEQKSPGGEALYGVAFENNIFIAVGAYGTVLSSPDGINWSSKFSKTVDGLNAMTFGNRTFVAVGFNGTIIQSDAVSDNCSAALSSSFSLNVPIINFNGSYLTAKFQYSQGSTDDPLFKVTSAGAVSNPADYGSCQSSVLSFDDNYKLHIPAINYNNIYYWVDLEYVPTTDSQVWFRLTGAGRD